MVNSLFKRENFINGRIFKNLILFIIIYTIMGLIKGLNSDILMSYIHLELPDISKSLTIFIGISMLLLVLAIIAVRYIGYKKVVFIITALLIISTIGIMNTHNIVLGTIYFIFIELSHKAFVVIIPLVLMAYTNKENRISVFAKAIFLNVAGETIASFFDGKILVLKFKSMLGISYDQANDLTKHVSKMNHIQLADYVQSYKFVIWICIALSVLLLILLVFIKETKADYRNNALGTDRLIPKDKSELKIFKTKYIIVWIIFIALLEIDSNLVSPHLPVYLNRVLHISRGTTSTLIALKSFGMMVFVILSPKIISKIGKIKHFSLFLMLSVPLMIILGLGNFLGQGMVIILGIVIFLRWGCTHSYHPTMETLPLTFVSKGARPILSAAITLLSALVSIGVGFYGKHYLFKTLNGYHNMFYIVAVVYLICSIMIFIVYKKDYDKHEFTD